MKLILRSIQLVICCGLLSSVEWAKAEDPAVPSAVPLESDECLVDVRVISGSRRSPELQGKKLHAGKMLEDVASHLEPLPFRNYRVVDSSKKRVRLGDRGEFAVFDAEEKHSLFIKPCHVRSDRVYLMVDWLGPEGETMLSTKLGVVRGKTVVVGTDNEEDSSMIMCIKVDCNVSKGE